MYQSFNNNTNAESYVKGHIGYSNKNEGAYIEHLCHPDLTEAILPPRIVGNVSTKIIRNRYKQILTTPASGNLYLSYVPFERNTTANSVYSSLLKSGPDVTTYTAFVSATDGQYNLGYNWFSSGAPTDESNDSITQYVGVISACLKIEYISNFEQASGLITYFPQISEAAQLTTGGEAFAPSSDYDNCIGNMGGCNTISKGSLGKFIFFPITTSDIMDFNIDSQTHKLVWRICLEGMPSGAKILVEMITNFELHLNTMHVNYNLIREDNISKLVMEQGVWDKVKHNIVKHVGNIFTNSNALTYIGGKAAEVLGYNNPYVRGGMLAYQGYKALTGPIDDGL